MTTDTSIVTTLDVVNEKGIGEYATVTAESPAGPVMLAYGRFDSMREDGEEGGTVWCLSGGSEVEHHSYWSGLAEMEEYARVLLAVVAEARRHPEHFPNG